MKKIGVFFAVLTLCVSLGGCFAKPQAPAKSLPFSEPVESLDLDVFDEAEPTTHTLSEISFEIPGWAQPETTEYDFQLGFAGQNESFLVTATAALLPISTEDFTKYMVAHNLKVMPDNNVQASVPVIQAINGTSWMKVFYRLTDDSGAKKELVCYMLSTQNGRYTCTFLYDFGAKSKLEELVAPTFELAPEAKAIWADTGGNESGPILSKTLVGEWDAGEKGGYLVFFEDGRFAWYQSSNMDENYVMSGTYAVGDEIVPLLENTASGFELAMSYDKVVIGGEEQKSGHTYHYEFYSHNKPDYFWVEHLSSGGHYEINKVA